MKSAHISRQAEEDLSEIWFHFALDNIQIADQFVDSLRTRCHRLAKSAFVGRAREELAAGLRSVPFKGYVIFYCPTSDGIEIARVLSGHRDIEAIFES